MLANTSELPLSELNAIARPTSDGAILQLIDISKSYGGEAVQAVCKVSMSVHSGEIVSILGPSGCGKTTTMRMIAGLEEPTSGDVRIAGQSVLGLPAHKRNIGLVFQSLAIFPHMSVRQNVAFGLRMKKIPRDEIPGRVERALDLVQLPQGTYGDRRPDQLSGGQLQRVALARTIVTEPKLVLFDEPMAALDRRLRDHMAVELRAIQKSLHIAAVYVTHDQETASMMSDRIAIMDAGKLVQIGSPADIYQRPANRFVAEFLGDLNSLSAVSQGLNDLKGKALVTLAGIALSIDGDAGAAGDQVRLLCRPEHVMLKPSLCSASELVAKILDVQFSSGSYRWRLRLADGQELIATTASSLGGAGPGAMVTLSIEPDHLVVERG